MILIVGLGNPGEKYQKTWHNLGFRVVDEFFKINRDVYSFSEFKFEKKFLAEISEGKLNGKKVILAKLQTFMNLSGKSVKSLVRNWKLEIRNLIVVHDDIDLPLGKFRIQKNRGAAGHKGVQSIINELGTKDFWRIRIGACPKSGKPKNPEDFVLKKITKKEEEIIKEVTEEVIEAIKFSLEKGIEKSMTKFNK